jgi:ferric-dicitrate binding protein FerR (iron transport regulator)
MIDRRHLLDDYLDGELAPADEQHLAEWLSADAEHVRQFVRETHLNRQLREVMLARVYEVAGVAAAGRAGNKFGFPILRPLQTALAQFLEVPWIGRSWTWAAAATCLALAVGLWVWCFGPAVGNPVLAQIRGAGLTLERAGLPIPAASGTRLQSEDVLHTGSDVTAEIRFGPENTRMTLRPGTEVELKSLSSGKRFELRIGKVEASVARQRPYRPMILTTPQAEARVLGTRFTLTVSTNGTRLDVAEGKVRLTRTKDLHAVKVAGGHYAVAAADYELAALPMTGGILREFWSGVAGTFYDLQKNPRFPGHPDAWDLASSFELRPVQTNRLGVRFRGYLHPPVTGEYEFWLAGATDAQLLMSRTERDADKMTIAVSRLDKTWDAPRFQGGSQWAPPTRLVAGRRYYVEALLLIRRDEGHLSVAWKGPGRPRELLTGEFLSPAEPKN